MSGKKRWQSRLSSHPHLPDIKEIPEAMRVRRGDRSEEPASTTHRWRTLDVGGELNPKHSGGIEAQMQKLARDCHTVVQRAKRYLLEDLDSKLV